MKKSKMLVILTLCLIIVLATTVVNIYADPTLSGGKGQLRVFSANNEPFSIGMPLLYFSFYQGYANEKLEDTSSVSERTLSNTLTLTFVLTEKIELSTALRGMILPSLEKLTIEQDANEWKLKYLAMQQGALSIALAPDISFSLAGSEESKSKFGAYLIGSLKTAMNKKLPFEFNTNIGFFSSEEFLMPLGFSVSLVTDYSEFFIEYSADNLSGSDSEQRITPGIRLNPGKGITLTFALDKTFQTTYPDKRFNILFSWLGPFSVFGAERK